MCYTVRYSATINHGEYSVIGRTKKETKQMFVVVDYDTKIELFVASYEMREQWNKRPTGTRFLKIQLSGCNHRIIIKERSERS